MNTSQLRCIIKSDSKMRSTIAGVYARDEIPNEINTFPTGYIVNTDSSNKPGRHWLAFYLKSRDDVELFDSYGHPPEYFSLTANTFNKKRIQSSTSNVCGQYCLYYLLHRCRGVSMASIVNQFGDNYHENDNYVYDYISNAFPYCYDSSNKYQTCCAEIK